MLPEIENDEKLQRMYIRKNLSEGRKVVYNRVFKRIYTLTGYTPTQLIEIAKNEQKPRIVDNQIDFKEIEDRTITQIQYELYSNLCQTGLKNESIKTEMSTYRAFLNEYDIQLPKNIQIENKKKLYETGDLPNKADILKAINSTNNKRNKALIYFMSSSGIRSGDVRSLRIRDLLQGCKYYFGENPKLEDLYDSNYTEIIPCFYFTPQKTNKYNNICCTFCSNEAMNNIIDYLQTRNVKSIDEYLFSANDQGEKMKRGTVIMAFRRINDQEFGLNRFGDRFFKPHGLRKYFINTCNSHSGDLLKVRLLSGHTISDIDKAYNEINISAMRRFYISLLPYLNLHDTSVKTVKSKEYQDLELKLKKQELENRKLKEELDERIADVVHNVLEKYR